MTTDTWDEVFDTMKLFDRLVGDVMICPVGKTSISRTYPDMTTKTLFPTLTKSAIKRVYHTQDNKTGQWHTTVSWIDGTKTTVACQEGDTPDKEKGLAMCICKKLFGNKGSYNEIFKEFCEDA